MRSPIFVNLQWHCSGRAYGFVKRAHGGAENEENSGYNKLASLEMQIQNINHTPTEDEDGDGALQGMDYWKLSGSVK